LKSTNSSFSNNTGWIAGGAVAVTERKVVELSGSKFVGNTLLWPELAAGGGFYCFLCESVTVNNSSFLNNWAAYGGGAAILQPTEPSTIVDSLFVNNTALPMVDSPAAPSQAPAVLGTAVVAPPSLPKPSAQLLQNSSLAILGPVGSNTTGDTGFYTGGGGLYVTVTDQITISGSSFILNDAWNGGEALPACLLVAAVQWNGTDRSQSVQA
jgi:hypothetical protein